jgi:hypothetical protein
MLGDDGYAAVLLTGCELEVVQKGRDGRRVRSWSHPCVFVDVGLKLLGDGL